MDRLKNHQWAGNVRELEQVITRHALIEEKAVLEGILFRNQELPAKINEEDEENIKRPAVHSSKMALIKPKLPVN